MYYAFKALTTFNRDIRQAGYTPDNNPNTKQASKLQKSTM